MKLEEALEEIRKRPGVPIRDLWSEILRDAWQDGLLNVQELLESIDLADLAWHAMYFDSKRFEAAFTVLDPDYESIGEQKLANFRKKIKKTVSVAKFDLIEKINSMAVDRGLSILDFLIEARASANLASQLQKNATKQGLYEPISAAYIWERTSSKPALLSHKATKLQVRFRSDGKVLLNKKAESSLTKSADILVVSKSVNSITAYLASHKYARVGGGHQMNQRSDAAKYLSYAGTASGNGNEIPGLLELCESLSGTKISPKTFSWEPCLILDGDFFVGAQEVIKNDPDYPELASSNFFVGDSEGFVELLLKTR
jgi:hypothetical protein